MNRARNADHYYIVKITRIYDYHTWPTYFVRNSQGVQSYGAFVVVVVVVVVVILTVLVGRC